jgi:hypothetical protein
MRKLDKIHNDIGMTAPAQDAPARQKQSKKKSPPRVAARDNGL